jgi:enoyl-[acyl-carrier protein] reductase II
MKTRITELLGIRHPIIQAGMSWASSCVALPVAVSNAGGLGVIAAGPMPPEVFRDTVRRVKAGTQFPYAVNMPLYRPQAIEILDIIYEERVPIIIASQGGPRAYLPRFRERGCKWIQVVSTLEHARKAEAAGVDAMVVIGAEAGGHPPANEVSTLVMVRRVLQEASIPVIAGGGVADGYGIAALLALGADGVQLGTRFLLTEEASVHHNYKHALLQTEIDGTMLIERRRLPIRTTKNKYAAMISRAEQENVAEDEYEALLRQSSLRQAALLGDTEWGKVETGQSAGLMGEILPAAEVFANLVRELEQAQRRLTNF